MLKFRKRLSIFGIFIKNICNNHRVWITDSVSYLFYGFILLLYIEFFFITYTVVLYNVRDILIVDYNFLNATFKIFKFLTKVFQYIPFFLYLKILVIFYIFIKNFLYSFFFKNNTYIFLKSSFYFLIATPRYIIKYSIFLYNTLSNKIGFTFLVKIIFSFFIYKKVEFFKILFLILLKLIFLFPILYIINIFFFNFLHLNFNYILYLENFLKNLNIKNIIHFNNLNLFNNNIFNSTENTLFIKKSYIYLNYTDNIFYKNIVISLSNNYIKNNINTDKFGLVRLENNYWFLKKNKENLYNRNLKKIYIESINPKNILNNLKYEFGQNLDELFWYKNNNKLTKSYLNSINFSKIKSHKNKNHYIKKLDVNSRNLLYKHSYDLYHQKNILKHKINYNYINMNFQQRDSYINRNVSYFKIFDSLVNLINNYYQPNKIIYKNFEWFDLESLNAKFRFKNDNIYIFKKNLNFTLKKIFKFFFIDRIRQVKQELLKNTKYLNIKGNSFYFKNYFYYNSIITILDIFRYKYFYFSNYKFKQFSFVFKNLKIDKNGEGWLYNYSKLFISNKLRYKKIIYRVADYQINYKFLIKTFFNIKRLKTIFLNTSSHSLDSNLDNLNTTNLHIYRENPNYFIGEVDKSFRSFYIFANDNLPWFEYSDDNFELFDYSFYNNLSEDFNDLEDVKTINNYKIWANDLFFNKKIINKYLKKNKILKKKNILYKIKRSKNNIWKIPIKWYFDSNFENFYKYNYRNTLVCFYEKTLKLNRNQKISYEFPAISTKYINLLGISNFNNFEFPVYSHQYYSTGGFYNDLYNHEINNLYLKRSKNSNKFWDNYLYTQKATKIPHIVFSYKEFIKNNIENIKEIGLLKYLKFKQKNINLEFMQNINLKKKKYHKIFKKRNIDNVGFKKNVLQKIKKFKIRDKNFLKIPENSFNSELKILWNPTNSNFAHYQENILFKNKEIINSRFLDTFKKKINKRHDYLEDNLNRVNFLKNYDKIIEKINNNSFRMKNLTINTVKESDVFFKYLKNLKNDNNARLLYVKEDKELNSVFINNNLQKPHTLYGYIWDEYLKSSYGFSLNFINFNNKIHNLPIKNINNKFYSLSSKDFQNKIKMSTNTINAYTGLTKDSEISGILLSNFLINSGFKKELYDLENLDEDFSKRKKMKYESDYKNIKKQKKKYKKKKLKIKKYFKRELIRSSIYKHKLLKKSINMIKKYNEEPVGYKYNLTKNSISLPYFKKNFIIINEKDYTSSNFLIKNSWLHNKNEIGKLNNRAYLTKNTVLKKKKKYIKYIFNSKRKKKRFRKNYIFSLNTYFDFSYLFLKNRKKKLLVFVDKFNDNFYNSRLKSKIKRDLKKIKPKYRLVKTRLKKIKHTAILSYKKNRNKKIKNFRLSEKFSHNLDILTGGGLPLKFSPENIYDNNIKMLKIIENRKNFLYDDYFTFYNQMALIEYKNEFKLTNLYNNYINSKWKSILKMDHDLPTLTIKNIKKKQEDSLFFENTLMFNIYKKNTISNTYLKKNYSKSEFFGYFKNYENFIEEFSSENILLDNTSFYLKDYTFFDNSDFVDFVGKNFEINNYTKLASIYSGISTYSKYNNYVENYNIHKLVIEKIRIENNFKFIIKLWNYIVKNYTKQLNYINIKINKCIHVYFIYLNNKKLCFVFNKKINKFNIFLNNIVNFKYFYTLNPKININQKLKHTTKHWIFYKINKKINLDSIIFIFILAILYNILLVVFKDVKKNKMIKK